MDSPKTPAPPDPRKVNAEQTKSNINTGIANTIMGNANEIGPTGSLRYDVIGYENIPDGNGGMVRVPKYQRVTTLEPRQQKLYDQQVGLGIQMNDIAGRQLTRLDDTLSKPINMDDLPALPQYDRDHFEQAIQGRLQPQIERDRQALEARLANQGIMPGSEAYREAMALQDRAINDARYGAILNAGEYANQEMSVAGTARERALQERLALRNQPINEIGALMSGGQVSMPQFTPFRAGNIAGTDVSGNMWNAHNANMQNFQIQQQNKNAMMGGIGGLIGSLAMAPVTGGGSLIGNMMMGGLGR